MTEYSPLGQRLDELFRSGLVDPNPLYIPNTFPTARVSVPVYDTNGTVLPHPETRQATTHAKLARHSERAT